MTHFASSLFSFETLTKRLASLGWIRTAFGSGSPDVKRALAAYQQFHSLPVSGDLDGPTQRSLTAQRVCDQPDMMPVASDLAKWPDGAVIRWFFPSAFGALNAEAAAGAFDAGCKMWEGVCGVKFERAVNPKTANLIVTTKGMDGAMGTLAAAALANGTDSPRDINFDGEEAWVVDAAPVPPRGKVDLVRVAGHELGHVIGIGHLGPGNLLQPMYSTVRAPQAGDIVEAVARYGRSKTTPTPVPPPPAGAKLAFTIEIDPDEKVARVAVPGYRVVPG